MNSFHRQKLIGERKPNSLKRCNVQMHCGVVTKSYWLLTGYEHESAIRTIEYLLLQKYSNRARLIRGCKSSSVVPNIVADVGWFY